MIPTGIAERGLAVLLALAVVRPTGLGDLPLAVVMAAAAWLAGPIRAQRPVTTSYRWWPRLVRHRNTAFAVACVAVAALRGTPSLPLAAADTVLLLSYLLLVDARTAGPVGRRRLRPGALIAGYGAAGLVLAATYADVGAAGWWARPLAVLALAACGAALAPLGARDLRPEGPVDQGRGELRAQPPTEPRSNFMPPPTAACAPPRGTSGTTPRG
jgi:hypothetical protein